MTTRKCECIYHRYHCVHIYKDRLYSHSQDVWDSIFKSANPDEIETFPSELYVHGMTVNALRQAAGKQEVVQSVSDSELQPQDFVECEFC